MAEKKKASKKEEAKKTLKKTAGSKTTKKTTKANDKAKVSTKKVETKVEKVIEPVDNKKVIKKEKNKKECKIKTWFNKLTLEQIAIVGIVIITILLIVLIIVSTKNTKTSSGKDIVAKINGKTITADDLYSKLKESYGKDVAINLIDDYILNKEYKTTDDMKTSAQNTIDNYKSTYGDSYESFLEYNGISSDKELKELLIKNSKLTNVTEDYIKETLTEKEMKEYYKNNIEGDIEAKHILISFDYEDDATDEEIEQKEKEAKEKAEEIIEKLKNGEDFATLAKKYSDDEASKEDGGNLGYFNTGEMVEEFEKAAYALEVNEYTTEPVKTTYGYHIIMKTGQKDKPSYKKSKDTIIEKLVEQKKEEDSNISVKAMIALREEYKLNIKDKSIKKDYNSYVEESATTATTASEQ